jgi:hypothetical protein
MDLFQEHANALIGSVAFGEFGKAVVWGFFRLGLGKELDRDGSRVALYLSENLGCRKSPSTSVVTNTTKHHLWRQNIE